MAREHSQHPSYRAYTVIKGKDGDFWQPIGAAFSHGNGGGFNIILQALPLDGKIVLREISEEEREQPADTAQGNVTSARDFRDRRGGSREKR